MVRSEDQKMSFNITPFVGDASFLALILRILLGASLVIHGYPKLKDWRQAGQWIKSMGIPASTALFATILEFFGGLSLVVGLIVPVIAFFLIVQFASIIVMKKTKMKASYISMDPNKPSYEIDVFYLALSLTLAVLGAGILSIDSLLF